MLVPTDKIKDKWKKYCELWSKIKDPIRTKINNSDDFDKKYMKINFLIQMMI